MVDNNFIVFTIHHLTINHSLHEYKNLQISNFIITKFEYIYLNN